MTARPPDENAMNTTLECVLQQLQAAATGPDADPTIVARWALAMVDATRQLLNRPLATWTEDPHRTRPARPSSLAQPGPIIDPSAATLNDDLTTTAADDQRRRARKRRLAERLQPADADLGRLGEVVIDQAIQISELRTTSLGPEAEIVADLEERMDCLETAGAMLRRGILRALKLPAASDEALIQAVASNAARVTLGRSTELEWQRDAATKALAELRTELAGAFGLLQGEASDAWIVENVRQLCRLGTLEHHFSKSPLGERENTQPSPRIRRTYRVFGLGESQVSTECSALLAAEPSADLAAIHFHAEFPEVLIDLSVRSTGDEVEAQQLFDRLEIGLRGRLGPALYGIGNETLVERVNRRLLEAGATVATAESCTGGMVGELITGPPGASRVFPGGAIVYSNTEKERQLGVRGETLAAHGAVSQETVVEMALGALDRFGTKLAVSVSGVAGPDGGSPAKPVGTVWIGVASRLTQDAPVVATRKLTNPGTREQIRKLSAWWALAMVDATLPTNDPTEIEHAHWILLPPHEEAPA